MDPELISLRRAAATWFSRRRSGGPGIGALVFVALATVPALAASVSVVLIPEHAVWKFNDLGANLQTEWREPGFNNAAWASGLAPLGYGNGGEATLLGFGPDDEGKYITTYFRHSFVVSNAQDFTALTVRLWRDDGAVVYLNGAEVFRSNMPGGAVTAATRASSLVKGADEMGFSEGNVSAAGLQNGTNVLAVEVHQFDSDNPDLSFDLGLAGWLEVADAGLVRGPYLQTATPTNLVVCWRTDLAVGGRVRYGTNPADLNLVAESLALATNHEVRLDGLTPSTRFFYSVEAPPLVLAGGAECSFITPPPVGVPKPTRVWVLGDSGTANANAQAVRDAYEQFAGTSPTDLWLMLGDNAYGSGFDHEYQRAVFEMYPTTLRQVPLWPTLGNHDWYAVQYVGHIPYLNIFRLPAQGEAGGVASGTELYYSFDYAHIHFVCLDSMSSSREPTGPMLEWLRNDLGQTTQDWIIAFWHHPPYSRGSHNSDAEGELIDMRANALPILEEFGADLVLCGHSHSYERSYLLHGHYGSSQTLAPGHILDSGDGREDGDGAYLKPAGGLGAGQGTVYTVAGSSGQTSGGSLNHPAMFISLNRLGSLVLDIVSNRLEAAFLQSDGVVADHFTLRKGAFTNGPAPAMTILRAGQGTAVVAWPTSQLPYAMQSTPDVTVTDAWHPATNVPWQVGGTNFIRLDTTGSNQFLRLRRQQP